ncbi:MULTISPECIES: hypothetical protein [Bradyrhizobium]|uniref:hypothetical protein n=1 Tax=Bradyrhizobium TaxID=374 RepID=UPI001EDB801F|nr:hypothetical protein [Bradyrhizobium zhengyangense]MCG2639660.1 hypothetical protein [Bradyrhizobium zhengyangense]
MQQHEPIAPVIIAKIDGARAAVAAFEAETAELALAAVKGKAGAAGQLAEHRKKLESLRSAEAELSAALTLVRKQDEIADVEAHHSDLRTTLGKIKTAVQKRDKAAVRFSELAKEIVDTYRELIDTSFLIENLAPRDLGMVHGFAFRGESIIDGRAFPCGLDGLISNELFRYSGPGKTGLLPKAEALGLMNVMNPKASESIATSLPRLGATIIATIEDRIERMHRRDLKRCNSEVAEQ